MASRDCVATALAFVHGRCGHAKKAAIAKSAMNAIAYGSAATRIAAQRRAGRAARDRRSPRFAGAAVLRRAFRRCAFDDGRLDNRRFDNDRFHHRALFAEHLDIHRPAEPEPRHGADRALLLSVVADRAPRAQHDLRQLRIGDIGPAEDGAHEFVAADRAVAVFDQGLQAFEDARGERLRHVVQAELASREVEHARTETVAGGSRLGVVSHGGKASGSHRTGRTTSCGTHGGATCKGAPDPRGCVLRTPAK